MVFSLSLAVVKDVEGLLSMNGVSGVISLEFLPIDRMHEYECPVTRIIALFLLGMWIL